MLRSLLLLAGICAITYVEFSFYPGHTFLAGTSQPLVAMMERLQSPGFLSRDLAATNPNLTYTIYDEVTLFLCRVTHRDLEWALAAQQLVFRFAGVLGAFLLCLSAGVRSWAALGLAALANLGTMLPGIQLSLTDREPTPSGFAIALTVLAFGLLGNAKPLLAGLVGGIALAYQPCIGLFFWLFVVGAFLFRPHSRRILRPTFPALIVFSLLLANAAQLQAGRGESHPVFQTMSNDWVRLQLFRTPELWLSTWNFIALLFYAAVGASAFLALRSISLELTPLLRDLFSFLNLISLLAIPVTFFGVQVFHWALLSETQLLRTLVFLFLAALVLWTAAAAKALRQKRTWASGLWLMGAGAAVLFFRPGLPSYAQASETSSIREIADWADRNTWGGSLFLFPDAAKSSAPGAFRGLANRAIYCDWVSGSLVDVFPTFGAEWYRRWKETGARNYSIDYLESLLQLPVEYVVLKPQHALAKVKPELATSRYLVYDAHLLQTAPRPLHSLQ